MVEAQRCTLMGASLFLRIAGEKKLHAQIEILASLQTVDREIKEQNDIKHELLGELQTKDKEIEAKKREISSLTANYSEREKLRQEKDRVLQDESKKTMDRRMRMARIKNVKELQALQREIEQIKQTNGELEEVLIALMEDVDGIKAVIQSKDANLPKIQDEWTQPQHEMRAQISG